MAHLSPDALMDLAEGIEIEPARDHLNACVVCQQQLRELQELLAELAESRVDVPEPSPLFWDHLSARVRASIAHEQVQNLRTWRDRFTFPRVAMIAGGVTVALAIALQLQPAAVPPTFSTVSVPTASVETAADPDDPSLALLTDLAADLDWDRAADAAIATTSGATEGAFSDLNDAERVELNRLLREAMGGSGA